jgi:flagellar hook-length control protein FliK
MVANVATQANVVGTGKEAGERPPLQPGSLDDVFSGLLARLISTAGGNSPKSSDSRTFAATARGAPDARPSYLAAPGGFAPGITAADRHDANDPRTVGSPGSSDPTVSAPTTTSEEGQLEIPRADGRRLPARTGDKVTEGMIDQTQSLPRNGQLGDVLTALALLPAQSSAPASRTALAPLPAAVSDHGHLSPAKPHAVAGQRASNPPVVAEASRRDVRPMRTGNGSSPENPRAANPTEEVKSANQFRVSGETSELLSTVARFGGSDDVSLAAEPRQSSESFASPDLMSPTSINQSAHDQLASAMVGFAGNSDGIQTVTVRLQPPELGQVVVRIDRIEGGSAHVDFTAEKPDTLQLLQHDEPRLQQLLDQAGIPGNGRTVSFQATIADQSISGASRTENMATGSGGSGHNHGSGAWRDNGQARQNSGGDTDGSHEHSRFRWVRFGLDITA